MVDKRKKCSVLYNVLNICSNENRDRDPLNWREFIIIGGLVLHECSR